MEVKPFTSHLWTAVYSRVGSSPLYFTGCVTFGKSYLPSVPRPFLCWTGACTGSRLGIKLKNIPQCMYKNAHTTVIYLLIPDTYTRLYPSLHLPFWLGLSCRAAFQLRRRRFSVLCGPSLQRLLLLVEQGS